MTSTQRCQAAEPQVVMERISASRRRATSPIGSSALDLRPGVNETSEPHTPRLVWAAFLAQWRSDATGKRRLQSGRGNTSLFRCTARRKKASTQQRRAWGINCLKNVACCSSPGQELAAASHGTPGSAKRSLPRMPLEFRSCNQALGAHAEWALCNPRERANVVAR